MTAVDEPEPAAADRELAEAAVAETEVTEPPEATAETVHDYMRVVYVRIRSGDSGVLPVVGGLLLISILFQWLNPNFLTAQNIVNLLIQGAAYMTVSRS